MSSASTASPAPIPAARTLPPVLGRLMSGTFWLALRVPLQVVFSIWQGRLILETIGPVENGAYRFAWGYGFIQFLLEFGVSSALQRQISDRWTRGDREGVDRAIACGMNFYMLTALIQVLALVGVAFWALPHSQLKPASYPLVIQLLLLQAVTAPCFGLSVVVSSVLQAARRYDFLPKFELLIVTLRFLVLLVGLKAGGAGWFFPVVVVQTALQIGFSLGPALWVMVRELGHVPHFRGATWDDYKSLFHISFFMAFIQLSVVLGDKLDTTVLGFMLPDAEAAESVYYVVSMPFLQLRQTGWMLAYLVMPAVASLVAARDKAALERIKYDGPRLHFGLLLPVGLLGWIYAAPFLSLLFGNRLGYDAGAEAPLMRLFLIAAIPLILSVPVQMSIGMNRIAVIALAAMGGAIVNLPLSCYLTARLGDVSGVIWGTVLTTLFSNFLIPGAYVFRHLEIAPGTFFTRTLLPPLAGAAAAIAVAIPLTLAFPVSPPGGDSLARASQLLFHLATGTLAYVAGYASVASGRGDFALLAGKLRRQP